MNLKEQESINDYFKEDGRFIGEYIFPDYKVMRGYIGGYGDELRLYYTRFDPPVRKASLCIVHGFGEHQGKFLHIADLFAKHNFVVHLVDLRGFGYSGGPRGSQTIQLLHMDVEVLLRQVSKDLPLFLYGHAMGGLLIVSLLIRNPHLKIAGVITTSPMFGFPQDRELKGFKYYAVKYLGHYLEDLVINIKTNPTALTKNNQHVQRYFEDKLMMPFLGIGMAQSILQTLQFVNQNQHKFKIPILILHGQLDSLANYHDSESFYEKCGSKDKEIKLFENGYHELQHDIEFEELKQIMPQWCLNRLKKSESLGILLQSRLNYGVPILQSKYKQIGGLILLMIIYLCLIIRFRKSYKYKTKVVLEGGVEASGVIEAVGEEMVSEDLDSKEGLDKMKVSSKQGEDSNKEEEDSEISMMTVSRGEMVSNNDLELVLLQEIQNQV
ncbi:hypothetical protein pb186bvf_008756 [Paramecium bursaria]